MQYPELRQELIENLKILSDRGYQQAVWVARKFPPGIEFDCLDYATNFLFADTKLSTNPDSLVGVMLIDQAEVDCVKKVTCALDRLLKTHGTDKSDAFYLSTAEWEDVLRTAETACECLTRGKRA